MFPKSVEKGKVLRRGRAPDHRRSCRPTPTPAGPSHNPAPLGVRGAGGGGGQWPPPRSSGNRDRPDGGGGAGLGPQPGEGAGGLGSVSPPRGLLGSPRRRRPAPLRPGSRLPRPALTFHLTFILRYDLFVLFESARGWHYPLASSASPPSSPCFKFFSWRGSQVLSDGRKPERARRRAAGPAGAPPAPEAGRRRSD